MGRPVGSGQEGSHRVLVGVKISDDMAAAIDELVSASPRFATRQDWIRAACARVLGEDHPQYADWERRARVAEVALSEVWAVSNSALGGVR